MSTTNQTIRLIMKTLLRYSGIHMQIIGKGAITRTHMDDIIRIGNTRVAADMPNFMATHLRFTQSLAAIATSQESHVATVLAAAGNFLTTAAAPMIGLSGRQTPVSVFDRVNELNVAASTKTRYNQNWVQSFSDGTDETSMMADYMSLTLIPFTASTFDEGLMTGYVYRANTLYEACVEYIDAQTYMYPGDWNGDISSTMPLFSTFDHVTPTYTRNTGSWLTWWANNTLPMSWLPVWNSVTTSSAKCGALISPRHLLMTTGQALPNGTTLRFRADNGTITTRTISSQLSLTAPGAYTVALLNADVAAGVGFVQVMPPRPRVYFNHIDNVVGSGTYGNSYPVLVCPEDRKLYVTSSVSLHDDANTTNSWVAGSAYRRGPATLSGVTGGNGYSSPAFLAFDSQCVLLGLHTGVTSYQSIHRFLTQINTAMTTLGGGYTLTSVDLSGLNQE